MKIGRVKELPAGLWGPDSVLGKVLLKARTTLGTKSARPFVVAALAITLLAGASLARATLDGGSGDSTAVVDPTESPSPSPSPSDSGASVPDEGGGGGSVNNEVVIRNITDGRFAHRAGSGMARVTGGHVSNTNSAAAVSSCTDCSTVAVATQVVLIMGDSSNTSPKNQAVAINQGCVRCRTFALAYQYVVTTGGIVRLTSEGEQRLAQLEAQIRQLAGTKTDDFLGLEAKVDSVWEKMQAVVDEEVVHAGLNPQGKSSKDRDEATGDDASPSPSPSESPSASPSPSESPSSDETGAPSPSPTDAQVSSSEPTESPSSSPT